MILESVKEKTHEQNRTRFYDKKWRVSSVHNPITLTVSYGQLLMRC